MVVSSVAITRRSLREATLILLKVKETLLSRNQDMTFNLQTVTMVDKQICPCNKVLKIARQIWYKYLVDRISSCRTPRLDTLCLNNSWNRIMFHRRYSITTHWVLLRTEAVAARLVEKTRMNWINE
jgi:hypothetical protein